jgi:hypothetical protein
VKEIVAEGEIMASWQLDKANNQLIVSNGRGGSLSVPNWSEVAAECFEGTGMEEIVVMVRQKPHWYGAVRVQEP